MYVAPEDQVSGPQFSSPLLVPAVPSSGNSSAAASAFSVPGTGGGCVRPFPSPSSPPPPLFFLLKSDALFFFQVPGGPFSESQGWIVPMGDDLNTTEYHPHCLRRGAFSHSFTHAFAQMLTPFSSLRLHFQRHPDGSQPDRAFSLLMETLPIPDAPSRFDASGSRCASTSLTTDPFTGAARARSTPGPTCTAGVFLPPLLFSRCLTDEHSCLAAVATPPSAEVRLLSSSW